MEENTFWSIVSVILLFGFVAFILTASSCSQEAGKRKLDCLKSGVEPIACRDFA